MMKKTMVILGISLLMLLSACSEIKKDNETKTQDSSEVSVNLKEEAGKYVSWMTKEQENMDSVTAKWRELQENYQNEVVSLSEFKESIESEILPMTSKLNEDAKRVALPTEEIKVVHETYLELLNEQHEGFEEFIVSDKEVKSISSNTISDFTSLKSIYLVDFMELTQNYSL